MDKKCHYPDVTVFFPDMGHHEVMTSQGLMLSSARSRLLFRANNEWTYFAFIKAALALNYTVSREY
jgi:hypothetical protein